MKRILFTSVGRRVELIRAFKEASFRCNIPVQIWGVDITETAPALFYCDKALKICRINDPDYIPRLLDICQKEKIDALIPTIDTDLLLLSQNKEKFAQIGTKVLVSAEEKIKVCRDKRYTAQYFNSVGLMSPEPVDDYLKYDSGYPAFIKPKDGSSSVFAYKVNNAEELKSYAEQVPDYIIQPFIDGTEYTVDIFCDFSGNPIYITPRIRLAVRAGEVLKTQIHQDETIIAEMKQLLADYRPCGAITVQLIRQKETNDNYYIEINPRFGGGSPITMMAGADSAESLLRLLDGEELSYVHKAACDGAQYSRFDNTARVGGKAQEIKAVIFDLDDTLFSEIDYVKSGFRAVAKELPEVKGCYDKLYSAFEDKESAIDYVLESEGLYTEEIKQRCVNAYRFHKPDISLADDKKELLIKLKQSGIKLGIITDGRPEGQKNKIDALGLDALVDEIIITDELGGEKFRKPNDISFRIMQHRFGIPFENIVYVGDNINKDFIAPKQLGMQSILFLNPDGLYSSEEYSMESVRSFSELAQKLNSKGK